MGDTKPSNNMLHKNNHTRSSIHSYGVGLDPVKTSYLAGWIERTRNIPDYILSIYITHHKKEPDNETLVLTLQTMLIDPICLSFVIGYICTHFTDAKVFKLHLLFQLTASSRKIFKKLSYPLSPLITEDTIRHNIVQMKSTSRAYIRPTSLATLAIII